MMLNLLEERYSTTHQCTYTHYPFTTVELSQSKGRQWDGRKPSHTISSLNAVHAYANSSYSRYCCYDDIVPISPSSLATAFQCFRRDIFGYDESWAGLGYQSRIYTTSSNLVAGQVKPVCMQVSCMWNIVCSIGELLTVLTRQGQCKHAVDTL